MDDESVFNSVLVIKRKVSSWIFKRSGDMSGDRQCMEHDGIKSKEEQERIMIACHTSPEGKLSGLVRIQNFKVGVSNIARQSNTSGGGGGGGIVV